MLNTTHHKALGCAPHLVMFGGPPTPLLPDMRAPAVPVDLAADLPKYAQQVQQFLRQVNAALAQQAAAYRAGMARRAAAAAAAAADHTLQVGALVMLLRPRATKLVVANTAPYLVVALQAHTVTLRNLATGALLKEHRSNVAPLQVPEYTAARGGIGVGNPGLPGASGAGGARPAAPPGPAGPHGNPAGLESTRAAQLFVGTAGLGPMALGTCGGMAQPYRPPAPSWSHSEGADCRGLPHAWGGRDNWRPAGEADLGPGLGTIRLLAVSAKQHNESRVDRHNKRITWS